MGSNYDIYETELKDILIERGWLTTRSGGSMGIADLFTIAPPMHSPRCEGIPIEVKTIQQNKSGKFIYNPSSDDVTQYYMLRVMAIRGYYPVYAIRYRGLRDEKLCELCGEAKPTYSHVESKHDMAYQDYKDKFGTGLTENERWEIFDLINIEKHKYRSDQKYPSYRRKAGHELDTVFPDYSDEIDTEKIVNIKDEGVKLEDLELEEKVMFD